MGVMVVTVETVIQGELAAPATLCSQVVVVVLVVMGEEVQRGRVALECIIVTLMVQQVITTHLVVVVVREGEARLTASR